MWPAADTTAPRISLKVLASKNASDGVKLYALRGLKDLFAIEPDKEIQPQRTVFQKGNNLQQTDLERNSIVALIAFIQTKPELAETSATRRGRCVPLCTLRGHSSAR